MLGDHNKSEHVWQSFDHPIDTLFPAMKFGGQQKLVGWKNSWDPAPGIFSFHPDPSGTMQFVLSGKNSVQYWESGVWDGKIFGNEPQFSNLSVQNTSSGLYLTFTAPPSIGGLSHFVLDKAGTFRLYSLIDGDSWTLYSYEPTDICAVYDLCGAYGSCDFYGLDHCRCLEGFKPRDPRAWDLQDWSSSGCVPERPLRCDAVNGSSDEFKSLNVSLLENQGYSYDEETFKDCEKRCISNCSCTAYSYTTPSVRCQIWYGNLSNVRGFPSRGNSDVFIRVAGSAVQHDRSASSKHKTTGIVGKVLCAVAALVIALGLFSFLMWWRRQSPSIQMCEDYSNGLIRTFSYKELKVATRNFRYKLGSGGFGSVFKGTLPDNTLVAVKKLEGSREGEKQFRAEISSLGNIHHVNLVRLRGFCAEPSQRLLVYDYMANGSLNSFLFNGNFKTQQKLLEWKTRFDIALGTARGLVYLHENCRGRIIHGDVKPENILIDGDFSPKLADFGLAKLLGRDFSRVLTTTRGTRGYLAPEWISGLPITPKVDVYSFGMTLFELISGRRNLDLTVQESSMYYFPAWAATEINNGNMMNIVDKRIANNAVDEEVRRAALVSLLCIQNDENVRPSMAQVVLMLEGLAEAPTPQIPNMTMDNQVDQSSTESDSDGFV